jgi:hypothetical protein
MTRKGKEGSGLDQAQVAWNNHIRKVADFVREMSKRPGMAERGFTEEYAKKVEDSAIKARP